MKSAKKKSGKTLSTPATVFLWLLVIAGSVGLIFLFNAPALQPLRDSLIYDLIIRLAISGVALYFIWFAKSKPPLVGQVLSSLVVLMFWIPLVITSNQALLLIDTIVLWVLVGYIVFLLLLSKKVHAVIYTGTMWFGLLVFMSLEDYGFINNPGGIHFWQLSLILSAAAAAVSAVLLITGKVVLSDNRTLERILCPVLVFALTFALVWSTACNLNYALDSSEPEEYMAVIENMEIDSGRRRPTRYKLNLDINGESVELKISQSEYYAYDVGDLFPVKLYQGAFDDPYYISGNM